MNRQIPSNISAGGVCIRLIFAMMPIVSMLNPRTLVDAYQTRLILRAYFEILHDKLEHGRESLILAVRRMLEEEMAIRKWEKVGTERYLAYEEAALAFIEERIEAYNPVGFAYLFDQPRSRGAFKLELELNWYNAEAEYRRLVNRAGEKARDDMTDDQIRRAASELVKELGAFPDASILAAYEDKPAARKLPDYIAAGAIERILRQ